MNQTLFTVFMALLSMHLGYMLCELKHANKAAKKSQEDLKKCMEENQ